MENNAENNGENNGENNAKRQAENNAKRQKEFKRKNPWYAEWQMVKQICGNPKHKAYKNFGGLGMKCELSREEAASLWKVGGKLIRKDRSLDFTLDNCEFRVD